MNISTKTLQLLSTLLCCSVLFGCDPVEGGADPRGDETSASDESGEVPPDDDEGEPETGEEESGEEESGPSGEGPPPVEVETRLCERIDECGLLNPGYDVGDCADEMTWCTDDMYSSERADWTRATEQCLELANCLNFTECFVAMDECIGAEEPEGNDPPPAPECAEGEATCLDGETLEICYEGETLVFNCWDACAEAGYEGADYCGFNAETGEDVCFCY